MIWTPTGPIALYVGKGSEVHFKDVSYKDLAIKVQPLEQVGSHFRMQRITPFLLQLVSNSRGLQS